MELKIEGLHFHDLRASFATNLLKAGVDTITTSRLTGHRTLEVLNRRYSRLATPDLMNAVKKLEK